MKKTILLLLLVMLTATTSILFAQDAPKYAKLKQYRKWGITAGASLYDKAKIKPQYGNYTFENLHSVGWLVGFEYDFHPEKEWSFQTGMLLTREPAFKIHLKIPEEELFISGRDAISDKIGSKGAYSLSIPFLVSLKKQLGNKIYGQLIGGLRVLYYRTGSVSASYLFSNNEESRQLFGMRLTTQEFKYYGGCELGVGIYWSAHKFLLKTNIIYTMNFQPIMIGEYKYGNLVNEEPSGGDYTLSGNYFALMFTIHFNKPKDTDY